MGLPVMKECRCGAFLPMTIDARFPSHNEGDLPDWMGNAPCGLSGQFARRREPLPRGWWQKYADEGKQPPKRPWRPK